MTFAGLFALLAMQAASVPPQPMPQPVATFDPFIIFFEWDSHEITPSSATILNNVISLCGPKRGCYALISAHADSSGPAAYNLALSRRRARSVAAFLRRGEVRSEIVETGGETRLLNETGDGVRDPQNRRAAIWFPRGIQW
jgi:outer membrane protein OmpA-like peptidoglycan-associated protein